MELFLYTLWLLSQTGTAPLLPLHKLPSKRDIGENLRLVTITRYISFVFQFLTYLCIHLFYNRIKGFMYPTMFIVHSFTLRLPQSHLQECLIHWPSLWFITRKCKVWRLSMSTRKPHWRHPHVHSWSEFWYIIYNVNGDRYFGIKFLLNLYRLYVLFFIYLFSCSFCFFYGFYLLTLLYTSGWRKD